MIIAVKGKRSYCKHFVDLKTQKLVKCIFHLLFLLTYTNMY